MSYNNVQLKIFREHIGLGQKEIGEILGIAKTTYSSIENGASALKTEYLKKLYLTYGLNPIWYFTGEGDMIIDKVATQKNSSQNVASNNIGLNNISQRINNTTQDKNPSDCEKELKHLSELLAKSEEMVAEKERMIQILIKK